MDYLPQQYMMSQTSKNPQTSLFWAKKLNDLEDRLEEKGKECNKVLSIKYEKEYLIVELEKSDIPYDVYWVNVVLEKIGIFPVEKECV